MGTDGQPKGRQRRGQYVGPTPRHIIPLSLTRRTSARLGTKCDYSSVPVGSGSGGSGTSDAGSQRT
jgi:hypothetical protein